MEDLRKMLKPGMIVQVLGGISNIVMNCAVSKDASKLFDGEGSFKIADFNSYLINEYGSKIIRIYDKTDNGLTCIWDRAKDFIKPVDWSKYNIKDDIRILVKDKKESPWIRRYFAGVNEIGEVFAWAGGHTGWEVDYDDDRKTPWNYAIPYEGNEHLLEREDEN